MYHVGSRNEAVGHTGATHLLEHLMFKGTPDYNRENGTAIAAVLEAMGARFNATTWFDRTNYYETLPSAKLDVAMKIESSRMRGSLLRDEDRQPEMTVVRNEFERGENSPFQVLYKQTFATAFREHPYHHPTIGWRSDIEGVTTERLKEFYDVFYHPNNATALVIGDFEEDEALEKLDRHFGGIPRSARPIPGVHTVEPPQEGERRFVVRRSGQVAWCGLAWRTVQALHPDTHALAVLGNILGGGLTSRLYQALVEKSLALSVTVIPWQLRDPALFSIFAPVRPGVEPAEVESVIRGEIARVAARRRHGGRSREGPNPDRSGGHLRPRLDRPGRGVAVGGDRGRRLGVVRGLPGGGPESHHGGRRAGRAGLLRGRRPDRGSLPPERAERRAAGARPRARGQRRARGRGGRP